MSAKLIEVLDAAIVKMEQAFQSGAHVTVKFLADDWQKINDELQRAKAALTPAPAPVEPVVTPPPAANPTDEPSAGEPAVGTTSTEGESHVA